ncbi:hypothetical protein [Marinicellulosiphila megalodicopiae]|uniref:hypothetical protein n=1 Tax=Marinicellulosiphila megalodicopiae TaxID=2724896 RepID=UPI003BB180DA
MQHYNTDFYGFHSSSSAKPNFVAKIWANTASPVYISLRDVEGLSAYLILNDSIISGDVAGQSIADEFFVTIGNASFEFLDVDGIFSTQIREHNDNGMGIRHARVEIYVGYAGLDFSKYILKSTLKGVSYNALNGKATLGLADINRALDDRQIMQEQVAFLANTISADATFIPINLTDLNYFAVFARSSEYKIFPNQSWSVIQIEDEQIIHTGLRQHETLGWGVDVLQRGALGTRKAVHQYDATAEDKDQKTIKEVPYLYASAGKMLYMLLSGREPDELSGLPSHWSANMPSDELRFSDFENLPELLWTQDRAKGLMLTLHGEQDVNLRDFINQQILPVMQYFMPVYSNGELGLRPRKAVLSSASAKITFDIDNIISMAPIELQTSNIKNNYKIVWDKHQPTNIYRQITQVYDADSIDKNGEVEAEILTLSLLRNSDVGAQTVFEIFDGMRDRQASAPITTSIVVPIWYDTLELGDVVRIQYPDPDPYKTGNIDRSFEITQINPDFINGTVEFNLLGATSKSQATLRTQAQSVLSDAYYTAQGNNLTDFLTIVDGVITEDATLVGLDYIGGLIYYYDGNLTFQSGVTLTIENNVELRIKGFFQRDGLINGKGLNKFDQGYFGTTQSGAAVGPWTALTGLSAGWNNILTTERNTNEGVSSIQRTPLIVDDNGYLRHGYTVLSGTKGANGVGVDARSVQNGVITKPVNAMAEATGTVQRGGAGLMITARGMAGDGPIILDGAGYDNGDLQASGAGNKQNITFIKTYEIYSGDAAPGMPGCFVYFNDGATPYTPVGSALSCYQGAKIPQGARELVYPHLDFVNDSRLAVADTENKADSAHVMAYVPVQQNLRDTDNLDAQDLSADISIAANLLPNTPMTPSQQFLTIEFDLTGIPNNVDHFLLYFYQYDENGDQVDKVSWGECYNTYTKRILHPKTNHTFTASFLPISKSGAKMSLISFYGNIPAITEDLTNPINVDSPYLSTTKDDDSYRILVSGISDNHKVEVREIEYGETWEQGTKLYYGYSRSIDIGFRDVDTYFFKVKAINAAGVYSSDTTTINVYVTDVQAPVDLQIKPGYETAVLSFTPASDDPFRVGHRVYVGTSYPVPIIEGNLAYEGADTSITISELSDNTQYYVAVVGYRRNLQSTFFAESSFVTSAYSSISANMTPGGYFNTPVSNGSQIYTGSKTFRSGAIILDDFSTTAFSIDGSNATGLFAWSGSIELGENDFRTNDFAPGTMSVFHDTCAFNDVLLLRDFTGSASVGTLINIGGKLSFNSFLATESYAESYANAAIATIDGVSGDFDVPGHITMQEDHFINRRFEMIEPESTQYILLCVNAGNNDVNGQITLDRTSGNYQASRLDVLVSSGSSAMFGGCMSSEQLMQSSEKYSLVTLTYNSVSYVAIKYVGNGYPETTGAFFTGRIKSTGLSLVAVSTGVSNVVELGGATKANFGVDKLCVNENEVWHKGITTVDINGFVKEL